VQFVILRYLVVDKNSNKCCSRNSRRNGIGKNNGSSKGKGKVTRRTGCVIPQDAYYKDNGHIPLEERQKINFDHPDSLGSLC
jgi:hypothetical protein